MERFFMERLKYIVEDSTIAELLGVQNFTNKESAILELVKNAYDAQASTVSITFSDHSIVIVDDGIGMSKSTIYENWIVISSITLLLPAEATKRIFQIIIQCLSSIGFTVYALNLFFLAVILRFMLNRQLWNT